jgi:tight adherence protein B
MEASPLILGAVFLAVTALVAAVAFIFKDFGDSTTEERLEVLTGQRRPDSDEQSIMKDDLLEGASGFGAMFTRMFRGIENLALFFEQADSPIARALRSGHSLNSGIYVVVDEMPTPISTEFMLAYEEQNLGVPIEKALKGMLKRMPNMDLKFFVTAVAIQKQAGGDLAEILDKIGYIIRERFKIMGQVQALTGEGRMSGIALQAMPPLLFAVIYYMNPDYVMILFQEDLGKQMLMYAIGMQLLGAIVIKKIINIKI